MSDLYNEPEIYDERFSHRAYEFYLEHYRRLFNGLDIREILDCSIGSGCLTLELCQLGYEVWGSDLSAPMLAAARERAKGLGVEVPLIQQDFRSLSSAFSRQFDCVMSTGNALAHVDAGDLCRTLREMDRLIRPGGYLYFDSRNWELALEKRRRFQYGNPFFKEDGTRVNYFQVWDYLPDGRIIINILNLYEWDDKIFEEKIYDETLFPFPLSLVTDQLKNLGYETPQIRPFPLQLGGQMEEAGWYCLLAHKPLQP